MIIYKTIFPNGKIYIGQTTKENHEKYFGSGTACLKAIQKYGLENIEKQILRYCKSQMELDKWEQIFILKFNSTNRKIGYNILPGTSNKFGCGSPMNIPRIKNKMMKTMRNKSEHEKENIYKKISDTQKKRFIENPELRTKFSGENNPMFGTTHDEEWRKNNSQKLKNYFINNPEASKEMSKKSLDFWVKFKELGLHKEHFEKIAEKNKKRILQLDIETNEIIDSFDGAVTIENKLGFCRMNIGTCCRKNKTNLKYQRYGYKWVYEEI